MFRKIIGRYNLLLWLGSIHHCRVHRIAIFIDTYCVIHVILLGLHLPWWALLWVHDRSNMNIVNICFYRSIELWIWQTWSSAISDWYGQHQFRCARAAKGFYCFFFHYAIFCLSIKFMRCMDFLVHFLDFPITNKWLFPNFMCTRFSFHEKFYMRDKNCIQDYLHRLFSLLLILHAKIKTEGEMLQQNRACASKMLSFDSIFCKLT